MTWEVRHGDCIALMRAMPAASVDAVVTDPPYELGFMGKSWDASGIAFNVEVWAEALRVLKPGGHLLAFSGSRTYHRMACAIEDAGFYVRDQIMWLYGSGFPKSLNLPGGLGTALKPAHEPICMARKPLDGTVAASVLKYGTGAINVDGCRIRLADGEAARTGNTERSSAVGYGVASWHKSGTTPNHGRWPANVLHDGSDEATEGLRDAARYFYCAKASRADREHGCEELPARSGAEAVERDEDSAGMASPRAGAGRTAASVRNHHPTVKPTELMRYLCRLVTPPGGLVLDPFTGSGSTGRGAVMEGFRFIGCEQSEEYVAIARARIAAAASGQLKLV